MGGRRGGVHRGNGHRGDGRGRRWHPQIQKQRPERSFQTFPVAFVMGDKHLSPNHTLIVTRLRGCDGLSACQPPCPWSAQQWQHVAVKSVVASDAPCKHQEDGKTADDRVNTDRTCQHEVHVHEHSKECGNAGQETEDQAQADKHFTKGDNVGPESDVGQYGVLQEPGIPVLYGWMRVGCLRNSSLHETCETHSIMASKDPGSTLHCLTEVRSNGIVMPCEFVKT